MGNLVTETTRWRWVFYVNVPIGIIALAGLLIFLPANLSVRTSRYSGWAAIRRIDIPGAGLSAAATICLLLGLTWGSSGIYDWSSPQVIGVLVAAGMYDSFLPCASGAELDRQLPSNLRSAITFKCYVGGHAMYKDAATRTEFSGDVKAMMAGNGNK